ncbi:hypothetical protein CRUP_031827 [Coryphaenoides rupestris]|nr:hypothetical protein CRUP_031827 [Coryphaenoides rupestris]
MPPQNAGDGDSMGVSGPLVGVVESKPTSTTTTSTTTTTGTAGRGGGRGTGSSGGGGGGGNIEGGGGEEEEEEEEEGGRPPAAGIPLKQWLMHGAVMFGREFCYAMETALVTPVLLQIGLPEQYYSLTWFLSPILGLLFTPLIGSASDRCTLAWGRRRPFILALCVGTLLGVALFLNGSLMGWQALGQACHDDESSVTCLALGDRQGSQPIGIVLTVLGVVVLDFCADATEGPIRAYLLDVANTEEQDMALNIHAAPPLGPRLGGAVGYALGGLDWTYTFLGRIFKSQEQILFVFAAIFFSISIEVNMSLSSRRRGWQALGQACHDDESSVTCLALGDRQGSQPIGIVLTVLGVVVLDFCADATEGPIRAYLLDVANTEEQDMALNIHAASAGRANSSDHVWAGRWATLWGALGWTYTFLGRIFKSQEQILFVFRRHLFSISLAMIGEDELIDSYGLYDPYEDDQSENGIIDMDFVEVELVRSKSDSVLAMADATLDHLDHDTLFLRQIEPSIFADHLSSYHGSPTRTLSFFSTYRASPPPPPTASNQDLLRPAPGNHQSHSPVARISRLSAFLQEMENDDGQEALLNNQLNEQHTPNGRLLANVANANRASMNGISAKGTAHRAGMVKAASTGASARQQHLSHRRRHTFYRQPSCTFSYYGRVGSDRYRYKHPQHRHRGHGHHGHAHPHSAALLIKPSRSMNDVCEAAEEERRHLHHPHPHLHQEEEEGEEEQERRRKRHQRVHTTSSSSGDTESEVEVETTVQLLWLSMLKMPPQLLRLCVCHLLTWFSIIAEATQATGVGTAVMAMFPNVYVAMVMISSMGYVHHSPGNSRRGFGVDCAILSCQVYISQILVASALGSVVEAVGSVRVIPMVASGGSLLGFFTAWEAESAKSLERRALTAPEQTSGNRLSVSVVIEKPSFLKLGRKTSNIITTTTTTTTTSTSCHLDNESVL